MATTHEAGRFHPRIDVNVAELHAYINATYKVQTVAQRDLLRPQPQETCYVYGTRLLYEYDVSPETGRGGWRVLDGSAPPVLARARAPKEYTLRDFDPPDEFDPDRAMRLTGRRRDDYLRSVNAAPALQKALRAIAEGGTLLLEGSWYIDSLSQAEARALGRRRTGVHTTVALENARNTTILGEGFTLYQGVNSVRLLGLFDASGVRLTGQGSLVGCSRHGGEPSYEHAALITVNYNSQDVEIGAGWKLTNSLGDCVYVGGSLVKGGELGYECRNVSIQAHMRQRYGDGKPIFQGGSKGRTAVAVICGHNVHVTSEACYGLVLFEPNLDGQIVANCSVSGRILKGPVMPDANHADHYWSEEPVVRPGTAGAAELTGGVRWTGRPGRPVLRNNAVRNCFIEKGEIFTAGPYAANIEGVMFDTGVIRVGATSGSNYTADRVIRNNRTQHILPPYRSFIVLEGNVATSVFEGNVCDTATGACISDAGTNSGDLGRNRFVGNRNRSGTALALSRRADSSTYRNNR